ncbi:MAG: type II secretion system F family protein [Patescibacteria group bacterium]|nr:type II secretion system F family protein [Patescibacteria group bacterium]
MQFIYKAKDNKGNASKGTIEADEASSASLSLREKGLYVTEIKSQSRERLPLHFGKKVQIKDKIIFTQELGIMLKSGLSIIDALESLKEETTNRYFEGEISKIIFDTRGGAPFSKALSKHPDIFDDIYVNMVKSGEESGKIEVVLNRLAIQMQKDYELTRKIKGALAYPAFVMVALVGVLALVMIVIIPQLKLIFDDAGVPLPILTRVIIKMSFILKNYGIYILAVLIALVISVMQFNKTPSGRLTLDKLKMRIPVIGSLLKKTYVSRFTRTFAALTSSGLPLVEVFEVSSKVVGNVVYQEEIAKMAEKVKSGHSISSTLKASELMPKMIGQLSAVGEKSGNVDEVFDTLADFFDRDIDSMTANLSTMLEPVLMVVMGVGIGIIIVSVLQPIYGLVNAI